MRASRVFFNLSFLIIFLLGGAAFPAAARSSEWQVPQNARGAHSPARLNGLENSLYLPVITTQPAQDAYTFEVLPGALWSKHFDDGNVTLIAAAGDASAPVTIQYTPEPPSFAESIMIFSISASSMWDFPLAARMRIPDLADGDRFGLFIYRSESATWAEMPSQVEGDSVVGLIEQQGRFALVRNAPCGDQFVCASAAAMPQNDGQLSIRFVRAQTDTVGSALVQVEITGAAVQQARITGGAPGQLAIPLVQTPASGADVWTAVFTGIPNNQVIRFTVTAEGTDGASASLEGALRGWNNNHQGVECILSACGGWVPVVGESVLAAHGSLFHRVPLIRLPGPGDSDIDFTLTYHSQGQEDGPVGRGWFFTYGMTLRLVDTPLLRGAEVRYPDGRLVRFANVGEGVFTPVDPDIHDRLEQIDTGYRLTRAKTLQAYLFDAEGRLTSVLDRNQNPVRLIYENGLLVRIENNAQRSVTLAYGGGRIASINSGDRQVLLAYEEDRLAAITDAAGGTWRFTYETRTTPGLIGADGQETTLVEALLTAWTDPNGAARAEQVYDELSRVTEQTVAGSERRTFAYDEASQETAVTDAYGSVTRYRFDAFWRLVEQIAPDGTSETFAYDDDFNRTSYRDGAGREWRWSYDSAGNLLREEGPLGWLRAWEYNELGLPVRAVERLDETTTRETLYSYDAVGNLRTITNPLGAVADYRYDTRGLLTRAQDFAGRIIYYTYNNRGDLTSRSNGLETTYFPRDDFGRLAQVTLPEGQIYTYTYDALDRLTGVGGPLGFTLAYQYDPAGNLIAETSPTGAKTTYEVNAAGREAAAVDPLGSRTEYAYGAMGELARRMDAEGREWSYTYDALLRLAEVSGPLGSVTRYSYDAAGNRQTVTDAEGRVQRTEYDALDHPTAVTENYQSGAPADSDTNLTTTHTFDIAGRLLKTVDPEGNPTAYTYDLLDRVTTLTNAEGGQWNFTYDAAGNLLTATSARGAVTTYAYDISNRLVRETDTYGNITRHEYNRNGWQTAVIDPLEVVTAYTYDDLGRAVSETHNAQPLQPPSAQVNVTTTYEFDLAGRLIGTTDPRGSRATYTFDAVGRLLEASDYAGAVTRYSYDRVGNLLAVTDANGGITRYTVDALNRRTAITNPEEHTIHYAYNRLGELTAITDANENTTTLTLDGVGRVREQADALGGVWRFEYNRAGRITAESDPNEHTRRYTYDRIYRPLTYTAGDGGVTRYAWDADSNLVSLIDPIERTTSYEYDLLNRLTAFTLPSGAVERYSYDASGSRTAKTDAEGITTRYEYDPLYRLAAVTQNFVPDAPTTASQNVITRYGYDASGGLIEVTNPLGAVTRFERDAMGRPTREIDPLGNAWVYKWDGLGNLTSRLDANGTLAEYSYYPDNMPRQVKYPDSAVTFEYDRNNNRTAMRDALGESRWEYDALNRPTRAVDALDRRIKLGYDATGNRTALTYPNGYKVRWQYDAENRVSAMIDPAGRETTYQRDLAGSITAIAYPNDITSQIAYTQDAQIASLIYQREDGKPIAGFEYAYSPAGDVTQITSQQGKVKPETVTEQYAYDPLHRLVGVQSSAGGSSTYPYDSAGNRLAWSGSDNPFTPQPNDPYQVTAAYNANNLLTQARVTGDGEGVIDYQYDANGNRSEQRAAFSTGPSLGMSYAYDAENRLVTSQAYQIVGQERASNRGLTNYEYDGLGRLMAQQYNPQTGASWALNEILYDGLDPIAEYQPRNCRWSYLYRGADNALVSLQRFPASSNNALDETLGLPEEELGRSCGVDEAALPPLDAGETPWNAVEPDSGGGKGASGNTYWYLLNARGDTVGLTKHDGQPVHDYRYDPYGSLLPDSDHLTTPVNRFTFSGKRLDENTGLVYFGARHYDPFAGVWLTPDLWRGDISDPISLHRTLFANANPLTLRDQYGYQPEPLYPSGADQLDAFLANPFARPFEANSPETGVFIQHHFYNTAGASYAVPETRLEGTSLYFDLLPNTDSSGLSNAGRLFGRYDTYGIEPLADGKLTTQISTQQQVYRLGYVEPGITGYQNVDLPALRLPADVEIGRSGLLLSAGAFNPYGGAMDATIHAGKQVLAQAGAFTGCPSNAVGVDWGCAFANQSTSQSVSQSASLSVLHADILSRPASAAGCEVIGGSGRCLSGTLNGRTLSPQVFTAIYHEPDMCLVREPEPALPKP